MKDITVILPIHKLNEEYLFMLENGVEEVKNVIKKMGTKHRLYG